MNTKELNELMKNSVTDAIAYIKEFHHQEIILDHDHLTIIDQILSKLAVEHSQTPISEKTIFTISTIFGAFIGEVFKNNIGGQWFMDENLKNAPFIVLSYGGKSFPFASICFKKITETPDISICKYYALASGSSDDVTAVH